MPPTALSERDQAWIDLFGSTLAAKLSPPKPDTAPEPSIEDLLEKAVPGSTIKVGKFELQVPEKTPAATSQAATKAARYEKAGETKATVTNDQGDAEEVDAEVEVGAKLLASIERPLMGIKVGNVEIGRLALGVTGGFIGTEIINGFISPIKLDDAGNPELTDEGKEQVNFGNVGAKLGFAAVAAFVGPSFMSVQTTIGVVAYPLAQSIGDAFPLDRLVNWVVKKLKGEDEEEETGDNSQRRRILAAQRRAVARQNRMLSDGHQHRHESRMGATTVYTGILDAYGR